MAEDSKISFTSTEIEQEQAKEKLGSYSLEDVGNSAGTDFMSSIMEHLEHVAHEWPGQSFHIECFFKREQLFNGMLRMKPVARKSRPTPTFNHAAVYYNYEKDTAELLWFLPPHEECVWLIENFVYLTEEQKSLIPYIVKMFDGRLLQEVRAFEGETGVNEGLVLINEEAEG